MAKHDLFVSLLPSYCSFRDVFGDACPSPVRPSQSDSAARSATAPTSMHAPTARGRTTEERSVCHGITTAPRCPPSSART
jgi:hypothetical protein